MGLAKGMGLHGDQGVEEVKPDGLYVIKVHGLLHTRRGYGFQGTNGAGAAEGADRG